MPEGDKMKKFLFFSFLALVSLLIFLPCQLAAVELSTGSLIYVPIYRSFYQIYGTSRDSYNLTSTTCIHNTDPKQTIKILSINYYDATGKLVKKFIDEPLMIKPWNSKELTIQPKTEPEEFGGNLIIRWKSDQPANAPIVEVLMTGQFLNRGVSFMTRGVEIKE